MSESFYTLSAQDNKGKVLEFSALQNKVVLVVNTASKCGFTPQYQGLEELHRKYCDQGLVVLGFPCDQFGHQEPGSDKEIAEFCQLNFGVSFPLMAKSEVNGSGTHPVFQYLKDKAPGFLGTRKIKWNFTKFLVDREGKQVKRFAPTAKPAEIEAEIRQALGL